MPRSPLSSEQRPCADRSQPHGPRLGVAASTGLGLGSVVHLAGQDLPPFHVVGVAASPGRNPAENWTVFLSDSEGRSLYGHPGQADLIGIVARPGAPAVTLADRVRDALAGSGLTVVSRSKIGNAENLTVGVDRLGLIQLVQQGGVDILLIAFFVVAGTVALSVAMRWRNLALLRAVGATPGQVARMITLELAVLGTLAGLVGYLPAVWLAKWALRGLSAHQLLPPSIHAWTSPWVVFIAAGAGILVAEIAGFVSARRVSRIRPAAALLEATVEPRLIHPVRLLLGLCALGGGAATLHPDGRRIPRCCPRGHIRHPHRLALLDRRRSARTRPRPGRGAARSIAGAAAVWCWRPLGACRHQETSPPDRDGGLAVAFGVAFVGANYFINVTLAHGIVVQGRERLVADAAVSAPGPGLAPARSTRSPPSRVSPRPWDSRQRPSSFPIRATTQLSAEAVTPGRSAQCSTCGWSQAASTTSVRETSHSARPSSAP